MLLYIQPNRVLDTLDASLVQYPLKVYGIHNAQNANRTPFKMQPDMPKKRSNHGTPT